MRVEEREATKGKGGEKKSGEKDRKQSEV